MKNILFVLLISTFLAACATKPAPRVYWGNYSDSLYELKKEPSAKTILTHKQELEEIISKSEAWKILPPPGISAELGKLYLEAGDKERAVQMIKQEALNYPEAQTLVALLLRNMEEQNK